MGKVVGVVRRGAHVKDMVDRIRRSVLCTDECAGASHIIQHTAVEAEKHSSCA